MKLTKVATFFEEPARFPLGTIFSRRSCDRKVMLCRFHNENRAFLLDTEKFVTIGTSVPIDPTLDVQASVIYYILGGDVKTFRLVSLGTKFLVDDGFVWMLVRITDKEAGVVCVNGNRVEPRRVPYNEEGYTKEQLQEIGIFSQHDIVED